MTTRSGAYKSRQIYADQAATSFPKPPEVIRAMTDYMETKGGNPGRGAHRLSLAAAQQVYACRETAAELFGLSHPERVVFTMNTTQALNMAIIGLLKAGDHVLCSDMEHNSVWRPLHRLAEEGVITYDTFETFAAAPVCNEDMILQSIRRKLTPKTKMIICAHAANICSLVLPIEAIGRLCQEMGIIFVVDGAQSAGVQEIHMARMHIDALCLPGHKGLLGPQGTGMLLLSPRVTPRPLITGGNGVDSLAGDMSEALPEMYEAGTVPGPGIAGLHAGMNCVKRVGIEAIRHQETRLGERLKQALSRLSPVTVYAPKHKGGVVLFSIRGMASESVGAYLDGQGICVRPGFHCSALGHRTLKTPEEGAVRVSFGYNNTERDCDAVIDAIRHLCHERP
ncbi:MAG: aminotransferase class V-fold PLP-dependent enzyme [Ruminococcaceae bacterium]|nr:aminotransferase class V-fold PLP-dependent enzyme [Oscillospiraceae bacterium]